MKALLAFAASVVSFFSFGALSFAATLASIQGTIQVNSGSGFHQVAGAADVAPGTSVMAAPTSSAEIVYSDGCRTPVEPGSVVVVAPISPCAQGQTTGDYTYYYVLGACPSIRQILLAKDERVRFQLAA
jgi:hypothetical protein